MGAGTGGILWPLFPSVSQGFRHSAPAGEEAESEGADEERFPAMFCREMGTFAHFPDMREYGSSGLSDGRWKRFYGRAVRMEFPGNGMERRKGARPGKAGAEKCPGFFFGLYRAFPKAYVVRADQVRVVAVPVFGPG